MADFNELFPDDRQKGNTSLRKVQLVMLRILKIVDYICKENDINYWLDGGTLLGAIRHKGFIPWDDDLDIVMPRQDFEKFVRLAPKKLPSDLLLQTPETERGYVRHGKPPAKVRDKNSRILEINADYKDYHHGIFIDIFPIDKYGGRYSERYFDWILKQIYRYLCSFYNSYDYEEKGIKNFFRIVASSIKKYLPLKWILDHFVRLLLRRRHRNDSLKGRFLLGYCLEVPWWRLWEPAEIYPLQQVKFEDAFFYAPNNWDSVLSQLYGDYMRLPDKRERKGHHIMEVKVDVRGQ